MTHRPTAAPIYCSSSPAILLSCRQFEFFDRTGTATQPSEACVSRACSGLQESVDRSLFFPMSKHTDYDSIENAAK